jgi:methyl-accepting chemotaxis protein
MLFFRRKSNTGSATDLRPEDSSGATKAGQRDQVFLDTLEQMGVGLADVCYKLNLLTRKSDEAAAEATTISEESISIKEMANTVAESAGVAAEAAVRTREESEVGSAELARVVRGMGEMVARVGDARTTLQRLVEEIARIEAASAAIHTIAKHTNLLALNAAIEAARAGEQGRGFAVVADEVRKLANSAIGAAQDISETVERIQDQTSMSVGAIAALASESEGVASTARQVGTQLTAILDDAVATEARLKSIAADARQTVEKADAIVNHAHTSYYRMGHFQNELTLAADLADKPGEHALRLMATTGVESPHSRIYQAARRTADAIGEAFTKTLDAGEITLDNLFSEAYQPIPSTIPQKYSSPFDKLADRLLPSLQEAFLQAHPDAIYAISTDRRGYVPTHNTRFCQPITGDPARDLAGNRTKRIFSDRTGIRCGAHIDPVLIQTYKRDTGEVMHDLSVPIFVRGRHWGGFRVGYPPQAATMATGYAGAEVF